MMKHFFYMYENIKSNINLFHTLKLIFFTLIFKHELQCFQNKKESLFTDLVSNSEIHFEKT